MSFVIPEGWQLVPVNPTDEMLDAAKDAGPCTDRNRYEAMLSAAPFYKPFAGKPTIADDFFGTNRRELLVTVWNKDYIAELEDFKFGTHVNRVYALVAPRRGYHQVRRKIWPAARVTQPALSVLDALGASAKGNIVKLPQVAISRELAAP